MTKDKKNEIDAEIKGLIEHANELARTMYLEPDTYSEWYLEVQNHLHEATTVINSIER